MPLARLSRNAMCCQFCGIRLSLKSNLSGTCCCPGEIRLLLLLLLPFFANEISILAAQWHLGGPLVGRRFSWQKGLTLPASAWSWVVGALS